MAEFNEIQLQTSCILNVPFHLYADDFTFIVNGESFQTSHIFSEILSPNIGKIHLIDPTVNTYTINTKNKGHFSLILDLLKFNPVNIPQNEIPFILEVIQIFGNDSIRSTINENLIKITIDNVFSMIKNHEKYEIFFSEIFSKEIDFISSHFNELLQTQRDQFKDLSLSTLYEILNSPNLQLETEDQLLKFVNELFQSDSQFSVLYEKVLFSNVSEESMKEFVDLYDYSQMTGETWSKLSERLIQKVEYQENSSRYKKLKMKSNKQKIQFSVKHEKDFEGIINYLKNKSSGNIENNLEITSSSIFSNGYDSQLQPKHVILYEDKEKGFASENVKNSWLRLDFKNNKIIPTEYTIMSSSSYTNGWRPKNWVIEVSNDGSTWGVISEEKENGSLNGNFLVHTFKINKPTLTAYRYFQIRQTGTNWTNGHYFDIGSIEIYGDLI